MGGKTADGAGPRVSGLMAPGTAAQCVVPGGRCEQTQTRRTAEENLVPCLQSKNWENSELKGSFYSIKLF